MEYDGNEQPENWNPFRPQERSSIDKLIKEEDELYKYITERPCLPMDEDLFDEFKTFVLNNRELVPDPPILYYGDPRCMYEEIYKVIQEDKYNYDEFCSNNLENPIIHEDMIKYFKAVIAFNRVYNEWFEKGENIKQKEVEFDGDLPTTPVMEETEEFLTFARTPKSNGTKAKVIESNGGTISEEIVTEPLSKLEMNSYSDSLPRKAPQKVPRKMPQKMPQKVPRSDKAVRMPSPDKSKEKAPKPNDMEKRTEIRRTFKKKRYTRDIRDLMKKEKEREIERQRKAEAERTMSPEREEEKEEVLTCREEMPPVEIMIPESNPASVSSFKRTIGTYVEPTNVFNSSNQEYETIVDKKSNINEVKFKVIKQNMKKPEDTFSRNYISIEWPFNGIELSKNATENMFSKLRSIYKDPPKGSEKLRKMYNIRNRLYTQELKFFDMLIPTKCFRVSQDLYSNDNGNSFNLVMAILRLMKGFKRNFDLDCVISYLYDGAIINIQIHAKMIKGANILIGEQIVDGKRFHFYMTTENIHFAGMPDGKSETFMITNLVTPEDIENNVMQEVVEKRTSKNENLDFFAELNEPYYFGKSKEQVDYPDIFTTKLKKWGGPVNKGRVYIDGNDEPIIGLPDDKEQIVELYKTPVIYLAKKDTFTKKGESLYFTFKIIFPYSYYTKENNNGRDVIVENVINGVNNGRCPFILKGEFDLIMKLISTYCEVPDRMNDTLIQNGSQHVGGVITRQEVTRIEEEKEEEKEEERELPTVPIIPVIQTMPTFQVLTRQPEGYTRSDMNIETQVERPEINTKPILISMEQMSAQKPVHITNPFPNMPTIEQTNQQIDQQIVLQINQTIQQANQYSSQQASQMYGRESQPMDEEDQGFHHFGDI